ncbi:Cupin 2, conserved barrel domain protein [Desulfovibrio sp. DV]|uniref:cupin domain-containing protein n=1 Tax=Desulfovibrio sp. DV TaxID=1844708 RepID=UPI00094BBDF7|nr:cupin domain-containing protein [Desulfovibrio sp. DV]OLN27313.1 Cupin 2, conserved barrel domain protein [Desulfovibrio sp. DV]
MDTNPQTVLATGRSIHTTTGSRQAGDIPWKDHPAFAGVALRHLVTAADTDGALSCHIVRLLPGASLASHVHDGQWELHEVVGGSGTAALNGTQADYRPGVAAVIPRGVAHEVTAGPEGLTLYAKFFPALL